MNSATCRIIFGVTAAVALLTLVACDKAGSTIEFNVGTDASTVSLSPPSELMTRAVEQQALSPTVMVNDVEVTMDRELAPSQKWSGSAIVPQAPIQP